MLLHKNLIVNLLIYLFLSRCEIPPRMSQRAKNPYLPNGRRVLRTFKTHVVAMETSEIPPLRAFRRTNGRWGIPW